MEKNFVKANIGEKYFRRIVENAEFARTAHFGRSYNVLIYSGDSINHPYDENYFAFIPLDPTEKGRLTFAFPLCNPILDTFNRITLTDVDGKEWIVKFYEEIAV